MASRFAFRSPKTGELISGPVMGAGGFVASLARLEMARDRAADGLRLNIYEPRPGCAAVYPEYSAASNGPMKAVPLAWLVGYAQTEIER